MMFDGKAFGLEIVEAVKAHVAGVVKPITTRLDAIEKHIADMPVPKNGKDADMVVILATIRSEVTEATKDVPAEIERMVDERVGAAVSELPLPEDGKSVTLDDVAPMIDEAVSRATAALPVPKDGVGLAGAVIDRSGNLTLTLTDGSTRELGVVVGKDADRDEIVAMVREEVAKIPAPKDGLDGVGFDDLDVTLGEDERTIVITAVRGENRKSWELRLPHVIDRGVYRAGIDYAKGDGVTWGGSFWIAQRDTSDKPETSDAWRLSVKRGRDGKEVVREAKPSGGPVGIGPSKKPNAG